ncbi:MAG: hypothetical protein M3Y24_02305 [Acidobacteriota bacterium]|nr:hypothetical protein [Acidobacteriota bacterium]
MVLPTTNISALNLLLLSLICFSLWPNLYKRDEAVWRFELFSLDFALGALLFAFLAAYTLGMLGSEMSFTDRMLIAGRTAEIPIVAAGILYAFGNVLLLASVSTLGFSVAFPLTFGSAMAVMALFRFFLGSPGFAVAAIILLVFSVIFASLASKQQSLRTRALAVFGGAVLGCVPALVKLTADPEFGPGPYATLLMLAIGVLVSTPLYAFFLMNIRTTGGPIGVGHYFRGTAGQHGRGVASGVIWAAGALALLLALNVTGEQAPGPSSALMVPVSSVLVCMFLGASPWKELARIPRSVKLWIGFSAACFAAGVALLSSSYAK